MNITELDSMQEESPTESGLVAAFKGLTQGVLVLVTSHLKLASMELKADVAEVGKDLVGIALAGLLAGFGYILLNVAAVLFSAWYAGVVASALCAIVLALIHLVGGALTLRVLILRFNERHYGFYSSHEIKRSTTWAKMNLSSTQTNPSLPSPHTIADKT